MGIMTSRAPTSAGGGVLSPVPADAPPPTQPVQGVSFKDAVLESPGSKAAGASPRGKAAGTKSTQLTQQQPEGAPRGKRAEGESGESKGVVAAVAETTEAAARTTVAATGLWRPFHFLARTGQKGVNKFTHSKRFLNAVRPRAAPRQRPRAPWPLRRDVVASLLGLTRCLCRWRTPSTSATSTATVRSSRSRIAAAAAAACNASLMMSPHRAPPCIVDALRLTPASTLRAVPLHC